jgi:hypothetical protein
MRGRPRTARAARPPGRPRRSPAPPAGRLAGAVERGPCGTLRRACASGGADTGPRGGPARIARPHAREQARVSHGARESHTRSPRGSPPLFPACQSTPAPSHTLADTPGPAQPLVRRPRRGQGGPGGPGPPSGCAHRLADRCACRRSVLSEIWNGRFEREIVASELVGTASPPPAGRGLPSPPGRRRARPAVPCAGRVPMARAHADARPGGVLSTPLPSSPAAPPALAPAPARGFSAVLPPLPCAGWALRDSEGDRPSPGTAGHAETRGDSARPTCVAPPGETSLYYRGPAPATQTRKGFTAASTSYADSERYYALPPPPPPPGGGPPPQQL